MPRLTPAQELQQRTTRRSAEIAQLLNGVRTIDQAIGALGVGMGEATRGAELAEKLPSERIGGIPTGSDLAQLFRIPSKLGPTFTRERQRSLFRAHEKTLVKLQSDWLLTDLPLEAPAVGGRWETSRSAILRVFVDIAGLEAVLQADAELGSFAVASLRGIVNKTGELIRERVAVSARKAARAFVPSMLAVVILVVLVARGLR